MTPPQKHALLIGVETYWDNELLPDIAYAEADISAMRKALVRLGYREENITRLVGEEATKAAIEEHVRILVETRLEADDTLLFFFVGHGLAVKRANFLLCWDTRYQDLRGTGIDLSSLIREFRRSPGTHIQLYLDCTRGEFANAPRMSEATLEKAIGDAEHWACFTASQFDQTSHSSGRLKRGIWAHHLVQAFSGAAPEILVDNRFLTAGHLHDYLNNKTPLTIRDTLSTRKLQTPWYASSHGPDFVIADLSPVVNRKGAATPAKSNTAKEFILRSEDRIPVRGLSGFKQGVHRIPKVLDRRAEDWANDLAQADLESDLAEKHKSIRANMNYTRKQIEVFPPKEGFGSIRTPDFQYTISVALDGDPVEAVFTREVSDIRHPDILLDDGFTAIFDATFKSIRLSFEERIKVEDLIDKAEAQQLPIDYPHDCSSCSFKVPDRGQIHVTEDHLSLTYPSGMPLEQLTTALGQALRMLPKSDDSKPLPPPTQGQLG
ncbi:caspase family protein [Singulisphaera sp. Ch08]|uniref:Caspase family protein n=1 Tax=Singulisphaera sp. Ch08 TaxID=3120278 RepID=A0AAU7CLK9_9BACT